MYQSGRFPSARNKSAHAAQDGMQSRNTASYTLIHPVSLTTCTYTELKKIIIVKKRDLKCKCSNALYADMVSSVVKHVIAAKSNKERGLTDNLLAHYFIFIEKILTIGQKQHFRRATIA